MLQTIQKIGPVLDLFSAKRPDWGVTEVAEAIGVPRSSAHALLSSLAETGLLQCRARGRYRLGWRVVELNASLRGSVDVRSVAFPVLRRLADKHGETVHLAVLDNDRVLYVDKLPGSRQLTVAGAQVGARLEPHCTAVGKLLLAYCSAAEAQRVLGAGALRRLTPATVTDSGALMSELAVIRASGVAFDEGESVTHVSCVAAPVRDDLGAVVAALSLTVPASRFEVCRAEYRRAVKSAGLEISRLLTDGETPAVTTLREDPTAAETTGRARCASSVLRAVANA